MGLLHVPKREREKERQGQAVLKRRAQREGKWSRGGEQEGEGKTKEGEGRHSRVNGGD